MFALQRRPEVAPRATPQPAAKGPPPDAAKAAPVNATWARLSMTSPAPSATLVQGKSEAHPSNDPLERRSTERASSETEPDILGPPQETGKPLDPATRAYFEPKLGRPLGHIRVHDDSATNAAAHALGAEAFAAGPHIGFAQGRFSPSSARGAWLLGHELAHTVQQQSSQEPGSMGRGVPSSRRDDSRAENEASAAAYATMSGRAAGALGAAPPGVYMQPASPTFAKDQLVLTRHKMDLMSDIVGAPGRRKVAELAGDTLVKLGDPHPQGGGLVFKAVVMTSPTVEDPTRTGIVPTAWIKASPSASTPTTPAAPTIPTTPSASTTPVTPAVPPAATTPSTATASTSGMPSSVATAIASGTWTATLANDAMDYYKGLADADREVFVQSHLKAIGKLLAALSKAQMAGPHHDTTEDMLARAQRIETLAQAKRSGFANEDALAQAQADFMHANNLAKAKAAAGGATPTPAQVAAQQQNQVGATTIAPPPAVRMTAAEVARWTTACEKSVDFVVKYAAKNHSSLGLIKDDFDIDVAAVEGRGAGVYAYEGTKNGRAVGVVGKPFAEMVGDETAPGDPSFGVAVFIHEAFGHRDYGSKTYGLTLYDKAAPKMPLYVKPVDDPNVQGDLRDQEDDAYGYQETEMYAVMRALPFRPVEEEKVLVGRLSNVKTQWEPRAVTAYLRGFYMRVSMDPRIAKTALLAFRRALYAVFRGADAAIANEVLR